MKKIYMLLKVETKEEFRALVWQFLKFGLVGVSNTAISYGIEMLGYYVIFSRVTIPEWLRIVIVTALSFTVSVINSYFWNSRFVFHNGEKKSFTGHARSFLKMTASYALTGLILAPIIKILIHRTGVDYWIASLISIAISVPLNFLLNKLWAFRKNKNPTPDEESCKEEQ